MVASLKSTLIWAAAGLATLSSARDCSMKDKDVLRVAKNRFKIEELQVGGDDGVLIDRYYSGICEKNDKGKLSFGVAVNVEHGRLWKSHIGILADNCQLLDAFDFPDDTKDCDTYTIPRSDYMRWDLTIKNINRPSSAAGGAQDDPAEMEIAFAYGAGQYLDHRQCECYEQAFSYTGDGLLEPDQPKLKDQWFCRCPFAENGDGS